MAPFDEFYKSFPEDEDLKWKFFEREVVPWFLKEDPLFSSWISKVWTFNDYPRRWRKKKKDLGTDLVFEDIYGNDWAVQAKCYDPKYYVSKKDIDSFISDSNRKQIKGRLLILKTILGTRINRHKKTARSEQGGFFVRSGASVSLFPLRRISTPHK